MNLFSNVVQTEAPQFIDLGLPDINTSNKPDILSTPSTRIRRLTYGSHCSDPDHVFGELIAVGIIAARSDQDYSYKMILKFGGKIRDLSAKIF